MTQTAAPAGATAAPKKIHIFRPGRHTTMAGEAIEFSQADLAATAAAYDPKAYRAPLVIGHPKTDDPAQGWVTGLTADESGLYALADQVNPAFAEAVRVGLYGAVSAKFYRPTDPANPKPGVWYPRHVGFLGAMPPAVKGLQQPEFSEADQADGVCFSEDVAFTGWEAAQSASLWRSLRDWVIGQFGIEAADKALPAYKVSDLESEAQRRMAAPVPAMGAAFSEAPATAAAAASAPAPATAAAPAAASTPSPQETTVTDQEAQALRDQLAARDAELAELRRADAARTAQAVQADAVAFAEGLAREARIPAAQAPVIAAALAQLQQAAADVEFGEGDAKQPLHAALRGALAALPPMTSLTEQATRERAADASVTSGAVEFAEGEADADRLALDRRIREHAAQHKVSYAIAARQVMAAK